MSEKPPRTLMETSNFLPSIPAENAGRLSVLYLTSIEFRNTALQKQPDPDDFIKQSWVISTNVAVHNIGVAFELIYKVLLLCDRGTYVTTHNFEKLHNELLQDTKRQVESCILSVGWESTDRFIAYLNEDVQHQNRKYYEVHSIADFSWALDHKFIPGLAQLHYLLTQLAASKIWINPKLPVE